METLLKLIHRFNELPIKIQTGFLAEMDKWKSLSCVQLFATAWTIQSMEFSRPEYWGGEPFPSPGGSYQPRDRTQVSCIAGRFFYQLSQKGSPRILECVAYPFSRGFSQPRNWTWVSCIAGRFFTNWAIREAPKILKMNIKDVSEYILVPARRILD